jgi:hypothetical protein
MNGMITAIIIIVLIRIILKFIYRNKAEVIVEKDGIPELVPLKNTLVVNHEMDWACGGTGEGVPPSVGSGLWDVIANPIQKRSGGEESDKIELGSIDSNSTR